MANEINAILTLRDETGREWLAGAVMMPLVRYEDGTEASPAEELPVEAMKDRVFTIQKFTIIDRS